MRPCLHHGIGVRRSESSELSAGRIYAYLVASDLRSSPSGWLSRAPTVALLSDRKVASGVLCVVVRALATGSVTTATPDSSKSDVGDHIRPDLHQIVASACIATIRL